ncbi:unnamed protein product [Candidula unifasciata]|uniref:Mitotic checkpoint serine/threonine-protein kinase BUB1 n=1 Tax=Candidula unifasciata TaxID=100452 RepID=A0A8S3ZTP4_9EUPU|nr:unnamed protein product [Candidula unifasciata]
MDVDDHEWELSKENVQPLRQGRHMSSLVAALNQDQTEDHAIRTQQNNFELELRSYTGDDPFSVWESYIKWTEQHYPKGGHDGQLMKMLERCLREFQADERYKNDPRFIHMWIKFACSSVDPVVIFTYMFDNGIGVNVATMYVEWAISLERNGDSKKADAIYTEGLNRRAQPEDLLIQRHRQFQSRLARNITLQIAETQNPGMDMGENAEKRATLGRLKASGPSHKVGVVRTGNIKIGSAGSLKDTRSAGSKQLPSRGIPIFQDENSASSLALQQTNEWQSLPVRAVDNRENDKTPGVWTDVKVKQKPGTVLHGATAPFQIHEDPDSLAQETPRKTTLINTQPLSSRKAQQTDVLSNLRRPPAGANCLMEIPMYQKDKIYNGLSEFSFEELKAIKYWRAKKEKQVEAERLRKEEEQRLHQERMQQQMLEMAEKLAQLQAQVNRLNFNRPADHDVQHQRYAVQQLELTQQIEETQALMSNNVQRISEMAAETDGHAFIQRAEDPHEQQDRHNTNSNSCSFVTPTDVMDTQAATSSDFITPTNMAATMTCSSFITPTESAAATLSSSLVTPAASQARPSNPHCASTKGSLRTPIFNNASTYSLNSSSSLNRSRLQGFHAITSSSNPSLESSSVSASNSSNSNPVTMNSSNSAPVTMNSSNSAPVTMNSSNSFPVTMNSSASLSSQPSTFTAASAGPGSTTCLTAPSPTVYTKEALQCVMGMFSTSFMTDEQSISDDLAALHAPSASKQLTFGIHEDIASSFQPERQCLKSASVKKGLINFYCDDDDDGKENMVEPAVPKSEVKPAFGASSDGLNIYCDPPEDGAARAGKNGLARDAGTRTSVKQGLGFSLYDDVEMLDFDKEAPGIDFTIECGARNEMTIAGLDSFSLQAKYASTPCVSGLNRSPTSSAEGYGEETKSYHQSLAASKVCPSASSRTRPTDMLKEDTQEPMEAEAERDVSMNEDVHGDLDRSCRHHVDTTTYITQDLGEKAQPGSGLGHQDPFDDAVIAHILRSLKPPITDYPNFVACSGQMPDIVQENVMCFGNACINHEKCIGEGGNAKIYKVTVDSLLGEDTLTMDSRTMPSKVIKIQSPACYWEFYVSTELRRRLATLRAQMNVVPSVMEIEKGYFFEDGSVLQMAYAPYGSLLNLVNKYKNDKSLLAGVEPFACLLTIELLHMFEQIHACGFIHGDVKPDNFLLLQMPKIKPGCRKPQDVFGSHVRLVQLIDFGQSIDLTQFPQGTTFLAKVATSGFQCIEMRTNRPWTFQTDLFGLVGTVHVVLFGSYMNVFEERGVWRVTGNFMRKWNVPLWKQLFAELLNVPSCDQQPNLASLRAEFETYFTENLVPAYNMWVQEIKNLDIVDE